MAGLLQLTPFEKFMLWIDSPAYPAVCAARLHFDGPLHRPTLDAAMDEIRTRHPLLNSTVGKQGRREVWTELSQSQNAIRWRQADDPRPASPYRPMNLTVEPGLRIEVIEDPCGATLTAEFHHACCDAAGIDRFLLDLLTLYARRRGGPIEELPTLDRESLQVRGRHHQTPWRFLKTLPQQAVGLAGAAQFLGRRPVAVLPSIVDRPRDAPPESYPSLFSRHLDPPQLRELRRKAKSAGVSLNELLSRDLFLAVHRWRSRHESASDNWLRMSVPVNLRQASDRRLPAANRVSMIFLDRKGADCDKPGKLLQSIHGEMEVIKRFKLGLTFLISLQLLHVIPGGLKRASEKRRRDVSFVFSNLGSPLRASSLPKEDGFTRFGDVVLRRVEAAVPTNRYANFTVCVHQYARRLTYTLNYDSHTISQDQARELMQLFGEQLCRSLHAE